MVSSLITLKRVNFAKIPRKINQIRNMQMNAKEEDKSSEMKEIYDMFKTVLKKLEKLDSIEMDMKEIKTSLEYAHAEIEDLKKENEIMKAVERIENLERIENTLREKVIDLAYRQGQCATIYYFLICLKATKRIQQK